MIQEGKPYLKVLRSLRSPCSETFRCGNSPSTQWKAEREREKRERERVRTSDFGLGKKKGGRRKEKGRKEGERLSKRSGARHVT
ncbi:hypothetical protein L484_017698 [Morus notabilis]|uniref:Uncharacterized protein n=1 Tax=Morus notabilis TaxID=981085 RepID=W9S8N4_9ROSA|nr:hypothetical protein L484_017698 [Morus notabilis]